VTEQLSFEPLTPTSFLARSAIVDDDRLAATAPDGWFRTGDLGVMHPDGYVELRDRLKDVIISGGEHIASVEVEQAIASHPAVLEVAVVARRDARFGERPVAFVRLVPGSDVGEAEIIEHVRARLAHFKAPSQVIVRNELPRTATGKVQKYLLRELVQQAGENIEIER
jgi:fatty-acyl-CoA synthase